MGNNNKIPFNKTIIKDGRIIRIRKDGSIKADLGPYLPKKKREIKHA
jgi:hypothetical protein